MTAGRIWHHLPAGLVVVAGLLPLTALLAYRGTVPALLLAALLGLPVLPALVARLRRPPALVTILVGLAAWGVVTTAWSIGPDDSLKVAGQFLGVVLPGWLVVLAMDRLTPRARMALALATATGMAAAGGVAFVDLAAGTDIADFLRGGRSFIGHEYNHSACTFAILLPAVMAILWSGGRAGKGAALGLAILVTAAVAVSPSGTAQVALGAGAASALLVAAVGGRMAPAIGGLAAVLVAVMPLIGRALPPMTAPPDDRQAVLPISGQHRLAIWHYTADRVAERPFAGWGLDAARNMPDVDRSTTYILTHPETGGRHRVHTQPIPLHPHNAALQVWLELGAPGAFLLGAFFIVAFTTVRWTAPDRATLSAGISTLVAGGTVAMLGYGAWQTWLLAVLAFTAVLLRLTFLVRSAEDGRVVARGAPGG